MTRFIQAQEATVLTGIGTSETQIVVTGFKTISGNNITQAMIGGASDYVPMTLSPRTPREEQVLAKVASADGDNITLDIQRAVNPVAPYDIGGGIAQPHNVNDTVVISNNPALFNKLTAKDNDETVTANWTFNGNNNHNGTETFTDTVDTTNASLEIAEATETNQPYTKGQTDILLDDKADDEEVVKLTSNQTVAGVKTFSSPPVVPTANNPTDAVNRGQMETYIAANSGNEKATDTIFGQVKLDVPADDPAEPVVIGANSPINEASRNVDPADDEGKLVQLESDGRLAHEFLSVKPLKVDEFDTPGAFTWTKPSEGTVAIIEMWGGGGGGGAIAQSSGADWVSAVGGTGGAYRRFAVNLADLNATEDVIVGAGGAARSVSSNGSQTGGNGGSSSFKGINVTGGNGGVTGLSSSSSVTTSGVTGPVAGSFGENGASSSSLSGGGSSEGGQGNTVAGASGAGGRNRVSTDPSSAASGGTSILGGNGGANAIANTTTTAEDGQLKGGGGGGCVVSSSGTATSGAGGDGFVRITVF